ncbi:MAG: ATP-binding protein [Actinobacteria bacterium]|nr:ATP-binding protein [Actinomycetota bacterium]
MAVRHFDRRIRPFLIDALKDSRVVYLAGARQVGKSTLVQSLTRKEFDGRLVTLDDHATLQSARRDPDAFVQSFSGAVAIDEVQRVPELLISIKRAVDRNPTPGRFLLTGSANLLALPAVPDALTGRIERITLRSLSVAERLRFLNVNFVDQLFDRGEPLQVQGPAGFGEYRQFIEAGGYPEVVQRQPNRRATWFKNYLESTVVRDITDFANVERADELPRLIRLLASQSANALSSHEISKKLGVDHKTVARYISLLETALIVERVRAWKPNLGAREISRPKLHFCDTGLLAHLLGVRPSQDIREDQVGKLFEAFVYSELRKLVDWSTNEPGLFHYRDQRREVDFVVERPDGTIAAIEVKSGTRLRDTDLRGLEFLRDRMGKKFACGVVVYAGEQTLKMGDRIWITPAHQLWQ